LKGTPVRVWKSVGAVAVYSRPRATVLAGGTALVLAGAGVGVGLAIAGGDPADASGRTQTATAPAATVTAHADASPIAALKAQRDHARTAQKRAYKRGYDAGAKSTGTGISGLGSGGTYVVRAARSANGSLRVTQSIPVQSGRTYWLCSGGSRLCFR
jgi:hypothetical protein